MTTDAPDFDMVVTRLGPALFGLACLVLSDPHEAEDAVQDTLELAWRSWHSLRNPADRETWLKQICLRRCLRVRQRRFRWAFLADRPDPAAPPTESDLDLSRVFAKLTARQRAVISLHYRYGYSLDECAVLLRSRPGTIRSHLARGLKTLRGALDA